MQLHETLHACRVRLQANTSSILQRFRYHSSRISAKIVWIQKPAVALSLAPAILFGLLLLAASAAGVATSTDCSIFPNPLSVLGLSSGNGSGPKQGQCQTVPFLSDLPSMALAVTCPMAFVGYFVFTRRLKRLPHDLIRSGLVSGATIREPQVSSILAAFGRRLGLARRFRIAALAAIFVAGLYMYSVMFDHGQIFSDLEQVSNGASAAEFRDGWWANYLHHPLLAISWILIGTFGAYYALQAAFIYLLMFQFLLSAQSKVRLQALTLWEDKDLGWRPIKTTLSLAYIGFVNFAVSFIAVLYILQQSGGDPGDYLLGVMAIIGVSANLAFLAMFVFAIRKSHIAAVNSALVDIGRLLDFNHEDYETGRFSDAALLIKAEQLQNVRRYPLEGRARLVLTLVPGIAATVKLVNDAIALFGP